MSSARLRWPLRAPGRLPLVRFAVAGCRCPVPPIGRPGSPRRPATGRRSCRSHAARFRLRSWRRAQVRPGRATNQPTAVRAENRRYHRLIELLAPQQIGCLRVEDPQVRLPANGDQLAVRAEHRRVKPALDGPRAALRTVQHVEHRHGARHYVRRRSMFSELVVAIHRPSGLNVTPWTKPWCFTSNSSCPAIHSANHGRQPQFSEQFKVDRSGNPVCQGWVRPVVRSKSI